jgi:hypothetical protein
VRSDFEKILNDLYDGHTVSYDPGYICSVYLILALGTLSELNHRAVKSEMENNVDILGPLGSTMAKKLMPLDWPEHDEFFERALAVKPDLRVAISSLQALILLHWYLYTEVTFLFLVLYSTSERKILSETRSYPLAARRQPRQALDRAWSPP